MKTWVIRLFCVALLASMGIAATGCHTVSGFGKDVSGTGQAIERSTD